jgi:hypothetical protein
LCKTAKEAWESLDKLFQGNESIQSSKYDMEIDKSDNFFMQEDETPEELYRRTVELANQLRYFGKDEIPDEWIKRKFVKAITPFEKSLFASIRTRSDYNSLSSIGVLSEFIAISLSHKSADDALARSRGVVKPSNLALKTKAVARIEEADEDDDDEEDYVDTYKGAHKCIALAMQGYWKRWEAHKSGAPRPPRNKNFKKKGGAAKDLL